MRGMYFNCFWCCRLLIIFTKEKKIIKKRKAIGSKLSQLFSFLKNLKRSSTHRRYRNRSKPEIDCDGPKRLPSMNGMHSLTSIITLTQIFFAVLPYASNVLVSCVLTACVCVIPLFHFRLTTLTSSLGLFLALELRLSSIELSLPYL